MAKNAKDAVEKLVLDVVALCILTVNIANERLSRGEADCFCHRFLCLSG